MRVFNFDIADEYTITSRYGYSIITSTLTGRTLLTAPMVVKNILCFVVIQPFDHYDDARSYAQSLDDLGLKPEHFTEGRQIPDDEEASQENVFTQESRLGPPAAITAGRPVAVAADLRADGDGAPGPEDHGDQVRDDSRGADPAVR
jgi:hypothetical protein